MKLAVLLYGQPRFWNLSYESILQETTFNGCTTDYYFHFWDKIAYNYNDKEYELTKKDKDKIVSIYNPKKYKFTNYNKVQEVEKKVFNIVEKCKQELYKFYNKKTTKTTKTNDIIYEYSKQSKNTESLEDLIENAKKSHNNRHEDKFQKSIFEICEPIHLRYYLSQFVSLEEGAKLITEEYDYIFRIRTDLIFATPDLYENEKQYDKDKKMFYEKILLKEKGVFCKFGDLQVWEGAYSNQQFNLPQPGQTLSHQPIERTICSNFNIINNKLHYNLRDKNTDPIIYNAKTQYLHMKDWYILGSEKELLLSMKNYINTIIAMIEKSKQFLITAGIDNDWSAGELVCGEVLGLQNITAKELGHNHLERMKIPNRFLKIANKYTKQNILGRPHVRVLADSDIPLKEQYKKIISM